MSSVLIATHASGATVFASQTPLGKLSVPTRPSCAVSTPSAHYTFAQQWLHTHRYHAPNSVSKSLLPVDITSMACSRDILAAGTAKGELMRWCVRTGVLLSRVEAHFKTVTACLFVNELLVTASEDALIHIWNGSELLNTLSEHSMPITSIWSGVSVGKEDRILSSSRDKTVKLWDLSSSSCLLTVIYPAAVLQTKMDLCETMIISSCADGIVYRTNLYPSANDNTPLHHSSGGVSSDYITYRGHKSPVVALEWSWDGHLLYTGDESGAICCWHRDSMQLMHTLQVDGPVINLQCMPRPAGLFSKFAEPAPPPVVFQKVSRNADVLKMVNPSKLSLIPIELKSNTSSINNDELSKLRRELERVKEQNLKLAHLNQEMYQRIISTTTPGH